MSSGSRFDLALKALATVEWMNNPGNMFDSLQCNMVGGPECYTVTCYDPFTAEHHVAHGHDIIDAVKNYKTGKHEKRPEYDLQSDVEWMQRRLVALDVLDPENDASAWELVYYFDMTEDAEVIKVVHGETLIACLAQARRGEGDVQ